MNQSAAAMKTTAPACERAAGTLEPIRVLHFADVHIGMANFGKTDPESGVSSRVADYLARMDEMIDFARDGDVDIVIFAGDAFRSRSPNQTYQREFAQRIQTLSQLAPTVLLVGNHDLPANAAKASTIDIYDTLDVPNVWVARDYALRRIATKRGAAIVAAAPYPMRARMLADAPTRGLTIAEQDAELQRAAHERLVGLAEQAEALSDADAPLLLCGHFSVSGARHGSERSVMLGRDVVIDLDALTRGGWDYVALGHIHRHQNLTAKRAYLPPVVYSGSLERVDFGEENDVKGFCWVELARAATTWRFVEVAARKLLSLQVDCRDIENPTGVVLAAMKRQDLAGAVVRLQIRLTSESETLLNDRLIIDELNKAGVFHIAGLRKEVDQSRRARLGANPEGMTPLELLERYFESRDVDESRRAELLKLARGIVAGE